jgi:hypothetical protein
MRVSRKLFEAVKLNKKPDYQIAHAAKLHPSTLSKLLCGIEKVKHEDPRVLALGRVLGLGESELFESEGE